MKYFDTFTGIGGFTKGIQSVIPDAECVGFSEVDKYAISIYKYHYPDHKDYGDITAINESELPDFDLFVGGFPCQTFSIAGKRQGFEDTRGTLFFDVARILKAKRPEWVLLENVKGLLNHDAGKTFSTIHSVLVELGYSVGWEVVNSSQFGVPQGRERIFIFGCLGERSLREILPIQRSISEPDSSYGEASEKGEWIFPTVYTKAYRGDAVYVSETNGVRILTPTEFERLQGFPDGWTSKGVMNGEVVDISDSQRYKCVGNSVTVNVIEAIISNIKSITNG